MANIFKNLLLFVYVATFNVKRNIPFCAIKVSDLILNDLYCVNLLSYCPLEIFF